MRTEQQVDILRRLRSIEGHTRGVARMVEGDHPCLEVLRQVRALQGALDRVVALIVKEHLLGCMPAALERADVPERQRLVLELGEVLAATRAGMIES